MYIPSPRSRPTDRESPATVPTPVTPAPVVAAPSLSTAAPDRGGGVCVAIPHRGVFFCVGNFKSNLQPQWSTHDPLHTFTPDRSRISAHGAHSGGTPRNSTGTSTGPGTGDRSGAGSDSGCDGATISCNCSTGSRGRCVRDDPSPRGGTDSSGDNSSGT